MLPVHTGISQFGIVVIYILGSIFPTQGLLIERKHSI